MAGAATLPCGAAASGVITACSGAGTIEFSVKKLNYGIARVAFNAGDHSDPRACQRTERTGTYSSADHNIDRTAYQQKTEFFVSSTFGVEIFSLRNFAVRDGKQLKLIGFSEMLENIVA